MNNGQEDERQYREYVMARYNGKGPEEGKKTMNTNGNGHKSKSNGDLAAERLIEHMNSGTMTRETYLEIGQLIEDMDVSYERGVARHNRMLRGRWFRKNWKPIAMIGIGVALLSARQLNTVPDRYFSQGGYTIRKVDDLFGSTYHLYKTERAGTGKYTEEVYKDEQVYANPKLQLDNPQDTGWLNNPKVVDWGTPTTKRTLVKPHEEIFEDEETDIGQSKVFNDLTSMAGNWHVR